MNSATRSFEESLDSIAWFGAIGAPLDPKVPQITSFDQWPGPEDERVEIIHLRQQEIHDAILLGAPQLAEVFERIRQRVLAPALAALGSQEPADAWNAPETAAWHAAWTAALVAVHLEAERPLPPDIATQWWWFQQGRWPSSLVASAANEYVVL